HDIPNRREIVTDAAGFQTLHEYGTRGNVVRTVNALGEVTSRSYDDNNNLASETDPMGRTTTYGYDGYGNRNATTNALGFFTTSTYDSFGHLLTMRDENNPAGPFPTVQNTYDPASGNLISTTDANQNQTTF